MDLVDVENDYVKCRLAMEPLVEIVDFDLVCLTDFGVIEAHLLMIFVEL